MKKIVINLVMLLIMIMSLTINFIMPTYAMEYDSYELQFKVKNNVDEKDIELYLLLPKEYILFAIEKSELEIEYDGANTLKDNTIPGIDVDRDKVQDEIYEEKGVEYIKIKLDKNDKENYVFNILTDYTEMDMKYHIKNEEKDYIIHINNFKIEKGICEIEYDYDMNIVKQPDVRVVSFGTISLIIILIIVIILGAISYMSQRR